MIRINVDLWPHGLRCGAERMATLDIIQLTRPLYKYIARDTDGNVLDSGTYTCHRSAHKNPWNHLEIVMLKVVAKLAERRDYCHSQLDAPHEPTGLIAKQQDLARAKQVVDEYSLDAV